MGYGIRWPSKGNYGGVNFHGMFMSAAMVFFQGEEVYMMQVESVRLTHLLLPEFGEQISAREEKWYGSLCLPF
ncbi:hypothetical protein ANCCAN_21207 [Ancylostoma caninum]|uniref:Uncharacterized protein n=1 Tax=Ancylostoma caninum TaxID=29170 RepID=A0A368FL68_ANCCA|nr:hypothetical protein ANCCAN_21207 [Ancylostoma caninum]